MRFLICGLGSIGRRHLGNLEALDQEDIVLYRTGKSTMPDDELADYPSEGDLARALDRWQPDVVLVTNPTALHLETALPAVETGATVFIEKPLSDRQAGLAELRAQTANSGAKLLIGYHFRFHPALRRARELIASGEIGRPLTASARWGEYLPGWHPWEDYRKSYSARQDLGGGVVLTLSHPLDYLHWLLGEVTAVTAAVAASEMLETEVEDVAHLTLQHANGALASVQLDYCQRPARHDLEIVGTRGTLRWSAADDALHWWTEDQGEWRHAAPPAGFERNSMFLDEMEHLIQVAGGNQKPVCTLDDGIVALQIALAGLQSAESGRRVALQERVSE